MLLKDHSETFKERRRAFIEKVKQLGGHVQFEDWPGRSFKIGGIQLRPLPSLTPQALELGQLAYLNATDIHFILYDKERVKEGDKWVAA